MAKKKEEDLGEVIRNTIQRKWRNRNGIYLPAIERKEKFGYKIPVIKKKKYDQITIPLIRKKLDLENVIPGKIEETFEGLGIENKQGLKPKIINRQRKDYGWHLVISLPAGISFKQIHEKINYFQDAANAFIELTWNGAVQMDVYQVDFPEKPLFRWDPDWFLEKELPILVGYNRKNEPVMFDLADSPHFLVAGLTGWGKTMALHSLANIVKHKAFVSISDPKRLDFRYMQNSIVLARDDYETQNLLKLLNAEYRKRISVLEQADIDVTKVQEYEGKSSMPYIVAIFDELAQISPVSKEYILTLAQLARAVGIHLVCATQRPDNSVIPGQLRDQFEARLCFKVASEVSSRVVLGDEGSMAASLPPVKGRAIFRYGGDFTEIQTPLLTKEQRKQIYYADEGKGGWGHEFNSERLLPR